MSTLKTFIDGQKITPQAIAITSRRIEAFKDGDWMLRQKRAAKRRSEPEKKYAELNLAKPSPGRGVSEKAVAIAVEGKPVARKVRGKILRAVNTILTKNKQPAVEMKALFEGAEMKKGKNAEKKKDDAKK